jgi:hypothetical protein
VSFKYNTHTLGKIEQAFKQCGYVVRYEKGNFNSGYCVLENKKVIVVNKFFDTEARINCLLEIVNNVEIDESLLDDNIRKFLVDAISGREL